jgi:hypothetical protein
MSANLSQYFRKISDEEAPRFIELAATYGIKCYKIVGGSVGIRATNATYPDLLLMVSENTQYAAPHWLEWAKDHSATLERSVSQHRFEKLYSLAVSGDAAALNNLRQNFNDMLVDRIESITEHMNDCRNQSDRYSKILENLTK